MSLRPYPEYKDSGVDWLDDIPAHWKVVPGKLCTTEQRIGVRQIDDKKITQYVDFADDNGQNMPVFTWNSVNIDDLYLFR